MKESVNCILYDWQDGPDKAFVREELIHITEDTETPPE